MKFLILNSLFLLDTAVNASTDTQRRYLREEQNEARRSGMLDPRSVTWKDPALYQPVEEQVLENSFTKQKLRSSGSAEQEPAAGIPVFVNDDDAKNPTFRSSASISSFTAVPKAGIETKLVTTSTEPPFHMFVYPDKVDRYVSKNIAANGIYEPPTTSLIYKLFPKQHGVKKKYIAVDLGSNLGYYSLLLASRGVHVISFEASPDTAWLQRSSAALNGLLLSSAEEEGKKVITHYSPSGSLTIIDKGVSDELTTGRLSRHSDSPGMTSFSTVDKYDLQKGASGTALDVDIQLVRAGDMLEKLGIIGAVSSTNEVEELHLLKVDVEGFELKALKGLDLDRYKFRYIIMEYFPDMLRAAGTDPAELLIYIQSKGYQFYEIVKSNGDLREIDGGDTARGLRDWAETAEKNGRNDFHINLFASTTGIEDLKNA